jgi:hypothetical protein
MIWAARYVAMNVGRRRDAASHPHPGGATGLAGDLALIDLRTNVLPRRTSTLLSPAASWAVRRITSGKA